MPIESARVDGHRHNVAVDHCTRSPGSDGRFFWLTVLLAVSSMVICANAVFAEAYDNKLPAALDGMGVTEHLSERLPLDLDFQDESGRSVKLGQFFTSGRPVILSFNYSNCPMLCSLQLTGLINGLKDVELTCGKDFEFVSVSIDPQELPIRAAQTRQRYYQLYERPGSGQGWHFLVGSPQSVKALTEAVGVTYRYLKDRKEYVHPAVCATVTPDGRLSQYLYGVTFVPQTLRLSLVEASAGKIGNTLDRILLFCFHYDAETGRYGPAARRLMSIAGGLTAVLIGAGLALQYRKDARRRRLMVHGGLCADETIAPVGDPVVVSQRVASGAPEIVVSTPH